MRDHRIDFFRGLAIVVIFIDHIPYNFYNHLTPRNYGLSDAAEAFVLIAGISSAYAYFAHYNGGAPLLASALAVKRAIVLYFAHISGSLALLGIFAAGAVYFGLPSLIQDNNVGAFFDDPVKGVIGLLSLGHQFGYFNILPMYVVLLLLLPAIMFLTKRSPLLALSASFALYVVTGTWRLDIPNFPTTGGWYFNPLAWQLLFTIGLLVGARLRAGNPIPYSPLVYRLAVIYLVASAAWALAGLWGTLPDLPLPFVIYGNDKTFLTMGRLFHMLAAAYVIGHSSLAAWLKTHVGAVNPLVMIGRNGLVSFCFATFLSMVGLVLKQASNGGAVFDTVAVITGLAAMTALACALELMRKPRPPAVFEFRGEEEGVPAPAVAAQ
jgi:hypothetical protein